MTNPDHTCECGAARGNCAECVALRREQYMECMALRRKRYNAQSDSNSRWRTRALWLVLGVIMGVVLCLSRQ